MQLPVAFAHPDTVVSAPPHRISMCMRQNRVALRAARARERANPYASGARRRGAIGNATGNGIARGPFLAPDAVTCAVGARGAAAPATRAAAVCAVGASACVRLHSLILLPVRWAGAGPRLGRCWRLLSVRWAASRRFRFQRWMLLPVRWVDAGPQLDRRWWLLSARWGHSDAFACNAGCCY